MCYCDHIPIPVVNNISAVTQSWSLVQLEPIYVQNKVLNCGTSVLGAVINGFIETCPTIQYLHPLDSD